MVFPRRVGGGETGQAPEEQIGDVFSRAVIAGCLVEADRSIAGAQLEALIAREVEHLLSRCRPGEAGLWSYFPDLPELPCDADDLAEVLHLLVSTGRAGGLRGQLDQALRVALYDGACPDGAFATWVIDQQDQSEVTAAQSRTARDRWGEGSDPEVVANLLSAVHLYDPDTHSQALARGASYLLDAQSADGSWHTGWYHGSLYGTYQCARALAAIRPEARQALDHATDFVLSTQHPDGGWSNTGPGGDSDPLGTALALLTLAQTLSAQEAAEHTETVERAGDRLRALANPDGSFAAVPFILMHPQRVPGRTTALSFGCASITTALVCRSAIAWDQPM